METTTRTELKRALGPWAAASIVVGTVIGSGIFLVPRTMIQKVGTVEAVFAVWVVGGMLSLAGALSYAELAAMLPEAGGEYAFLREAYGPLWGFLYSWTQLWVAKSGSIATLATGFFLYLTTFFEPLKGVIYTVPLNIGPGGRPLEIQYGQLFAIALILSLGWLNYYGVKVGGNVQVAVTFLKVALIAAIILAGLFLGHPHAPEAASVAPPHLHRLHRSTGSCALGLRRMEQREYGVLGNQESAKKPAACSNRRNLVRNRHLYAGKCRILSRDGSLGSRRQYARRRRNDAEDFPGAGCRRGFHRRHDQHFRRSQWFDPFRSPCTLRGSPGRLLFPRHRPRTPPAPHPRSVNYRTYSLVVLFGTFRKI